jgi:hypothetical protein
MVERKVLDVSFEGKPVEEATIKSGKYQAKILSLGEILSDLRCGRNGKPQRVIARMDDVLANLTSPPTGR